MGLLSTPLPPFLLFFTALHRPPCSVASPKAPQPCFQKSWKVAPLSIPFWPPRWDCLWEQVPAAQPSSSRVWPRHSGPQTRRPRTADTPSVDLPAGSWSVCHHRHFWGSLAEVVGAEALGQSGCGGQGLVASSQPYGAPQGDLGLPAPLSRSPFLMRFGAHVRGVWGWDVAG